MMVHLRVYKYKEEDDTCGMYMHEVLFLNKLKPIIHHWRYIQKHRIKNIFIGHTWFFEQTFFFFLVDG